MTAEPPPSHWRTLDFWLFVAIIILIAATAYVVL